MERARLRVRLDVLLLDRRHRRAPPGSFSHTAGDATLISLARWLSGGLAGTRVRDTPWGRTIVVGVLMMAAYLAVLAAMTQAPVSYVVAAREVSVVVAAILGALVLRERHPAGRIAGAAVIFAGLVLIALAR